MRWIRDRLNVQCKKAFVHVYCTNTTDHNGSVHVYAVFFLSYICNFVIGRSILLHLHHNRYDICCPNKAVLSLTIRGMKIDT
jgi:hypothetical protein